MVLLSDGWGTGDVTDLANQMERLSRLAHRVVWASPRAARPGFTPTAGRMAASLPWCDQLVEGHSLGALEALARTVAGATSATSRGSRRRHTVAGGTGHGWPEDHLVDRPGHVPDASDPGGTQGA